MPDLGLDFRSDTLTQPTRAMRTAMAEAPVGDDVFSEDPTVNALQDRIAEMLGTESALYVPTGTMANQIAIRLHCRPGDEFLCDAECHINRYEQAAHVQMSGVAARPIAGQHGVVRPEQFAEVLLPANDHVPRSRLVIIENTHNRGAGQVQPYDDTVTICAWAKENGLRRHLDGARLFNAVVASGIAARDWAQNFDTISVCFSKGLGAPVGSALCGPAELIKDARRHRKPFGGGMRQAGIIAAGALYALEHHVDRLADDHAMAQRMAEAIESVDGLTVATPDVPTNMVYFDVEERLGTAPAFASRLDQAGIRMLALSMTQIRAVTHIDLDVDAAERAGVILQQVAAEAAAGKPVDVGLHEYG